MQFFYTDSYLNQTDPTNVVNYYINNRFILDLSTKHHKKAEFYLQPGNWTENDPFNYLSPKFVKDKIFKMGDIRSYDTAREENSETALFTATLRLDHNKYDVELEKFSTRSWLAETGGIFNMIYSFFYVILIYLGRYIFMNKLIGELFLVKSHNSAKDNTKVFSKEYKTMKLAVKKQLGEEKKKPERLGSIVNRNTEGKFELDHKFVGKEES